jgi:hypothetical protein
MHSHTPKNPSRAITFILQHCDLDGGAPSTPVSVPTLAIALDAGRSAATLPEIEIRLRQLS